MHHDEKDFGYRCKRFRGKPTGGEMEGGVHYHCPKAWGDGHHGCRCGGGVLHKEPSRCGGASGGDIQYRVLRGAPGRELPHERGGGVQCGTGLGKVRGETGVLLQRPGV